MLVSRKPLNFLRGWPAPELLPASLLSSACQRILTDQQEYTPILEYGPDEGYPRLREGLAKWLGRHYNVTSDPERICITGGASQNLACILQSFSDVNYTRAVWMVAPCYHLAAAIFEDSGFGGRLRATPEDDEGIDLAVLESKIQALEEQEKSKPQAKPFKLEDEQRKLYRHLIYVVPTCSNPSGKTMSLRRRKGLVELARKYNALVISDDVYDFLQWPLNEPVNGKWPASMKIPRLCDIDLAMGKAEGDPHGFGHAISNGSFSKISGPGIRTGWTEASPAFVTGLSRTASTRSGGAPSQLCASMAAELVENGELEKFIEETGRPSMQRRHALMMDTIHKYLAPLGVKSRVSSETGGNSYGGYFIWLEIGHDFPAQLVAASVEKEEDIIVGYGNMFAVHGDEEAVRFDHCLRLCFAWEAEADLVDGVKRIAKVMTRMQANKQQYLAMADSVATDMGKHV